MSVLRSGWPFLVMAVAFLVLAYLGWLWWPVGVDPCGSASGAPVPGAAVGADFCGGKRTTAGVVVPAGLAGVGVVVGALGLIPVRR